MKICDLCKKVVDRLESGAMDIEKIEVCEECNRELSGRFRQVEQRLAECKRQWRKEAIADWKRTRTAQVNRIA